jgi:hypothetical protein
MDKAFYTLVLNSFIKRRFKYGFKKRLLKNVSKTFHQDQSATSSRMNQ